MHKHSHPTALSLRGGALGALAASLVAALALGSPAAAPETSEAAQPKHNRALKFLRHRFPVPARHSYGDGFGAGRGHQGQDLFARCGKRVVAARGGRVQYRGRDGGAGNYVVIDGRRTKVDYVYMHMRRNLPREGKRVRTGEAIGRVGSSGNASGCHLHFELWSRPGWYEGGHAKRSVTRYLRSWDRQR